MDVMNIFRATSVLVVVMAGPAMAESAPPPLPIDQLTEFYHAMGGDNWHRNDGWLDPEVDVCDWYGISCRTERWDDDPYQWVGHIRLANNNLHGKLSARMIHHFNGSSEVGLPSIELDLSRNAISGELSMLPVGVPRLILADNRFEGQLPSPQGFTGFPPPPPPMRLRHLDLSGNDLTGTVPALWSMALQLEHLDLSDNRLEGNIESAVGALDASPARLWLADNAFTGRIEPDWFADRELDSINLCWTDIFIDDPELDDWIAEHHLGGPHHACLDRERQPLDVTLSGSWYDPERDGEGFTMMFLDTGAPLVYWFTHVAQARQMWQFTVGSAGDTTLRFRPMQRTRGSFETGFGTVKNPLIRGGQWRLDRVGDELLHGEHLIAYTGYDLYGDGLTWPPTLDSAARRDYQRLTRLAGTTCDSRLPHDWVSGAWYSPELNGQGFVVEVIENGRGVVYWFTYTPESQHNHRAVAAGNDWQAWMMGDGDFDGTTLHIDNLVRPRDMEGNMPGNADGIDFPHFGTLTLEFDNDKNGHAWFDGIDEDYGSGDYPIERLARPKLADCEE